MKNQSIASEAEAMASPGAQVPGVPKLEWNSPQSSSENTLLEKGLLGLQLPLCEDTLRGNVCQVSPKGLNGSLSTC